MSKFHPAPNAVRDARRAKYLTQQELAAISGVNSQTISRLECGGGSHASTLRKIAAALGVSMESLVPSP